MGATRARGSQRPAAKIRHRNAAAWLFADEAPIAALDASELSAETGVDRSDLLWATDPISSELVECASAISEAWEGLEPFDYGPVVILHAFWILPAWRGRLDLAALLTAFADSLSRKRSIVMLRASALIDRVSRGEEHDGREPALERLYARRLGAQLLPGEAGDECWMWIPRPDLAHFMPKPGGDGPPHRGG